MIRKTVSDSSLREKSVQFIDVEDDEETCSSILKEFEVISSAQVVIKETTVSLEQLQKELEGKKTRLADMKAKQQAFGGVSEEILVYLKASIEKLNARLQKID